MLILSNETVKKMREWGESSSYTDCNVFLAVCLKIFLTAIFQTITPYRTLMSFVFARENTFERLDTFLTQRGVVCLAYFF